MPTADAAASESPSLASAAPPAPPPPEPSYDPAADPELAERINDGCKYRRSSGKLVACEADELPAGVWRPSPAQIGEVLKRSREMCYCATQSYVLGRFCADTTHAGSFHYTVGRPDEATDCTVSVDPVSWGERHFVRVAAANRDVSTFYTVLAIAEVTPRGVEPYYQGFNALGQSPFQVSERMRAEWAQLPQSLRVALGESTPIDFADALLLER